jgi:hypothetical protein
MGDRCPNCGNYTWDDDICSYCGYSREKTKPHFELGDVDTSRLAHDLDRKKREKEGLIIPTLSDCIYCLKHSLHYELKDDIFSCVKSKCTMFNKPITFNTKDFNRIIECLKHKEK